MKSLLVRIRCLSCSGAPHVFIYIVVMNKTQEEYIDMIYSLFLARDTGEIVMVAKVPLNRNLGFCISIKRFIRIPY